MSALDTFRRAMRRHEKRARRMGRSNVATVLRDLRIERHAERDPASWLLGNAASLRQTKDKIVDGKKRKHAFLRQAAWFRERAADAVTRLSAGLAREAEEAQREEDERPYVCPGCYAIGDEACASWCPDAAIERDREERAMYGGDDDDDPLYDADDAGDYSA